MALRKDLRVIVVDDMSVSRQLLVQMLENIGIRSVRSARDAEDALEQIRQHPADMVIADLNMPGTDGLMLLKVLRAGRRTRNVAYVMTSADDSSARIVEAQRFGLNRFLPKPFDLPRLVRCLESITGRI